MTGPFKKMEASKRGKYRCFFAPLKNTWFLKKTCMNWYLRIATLMSWPLLKCHKLNNHTKDAWRAWQFPTFNTQCILSLQIQRFFDFLLFSRPPKNQQKIIFNTAGLPPRPLLLNTWIFGFRPKASKEGPWREQRAKSAYKTQRFLILLKLMKKISYSIHLRFCSDHAVVLPLKVPLYDPLFSSKVHFLNVSNIIKNVHPRCSHSTFWPKLAFPSERCC